MEKNEIEKAVQTIKTGGILLYPTDTLFGIGVDATKKNDIEKIYRIKKRERTKPLSVIMANISMIKKYCIINTNEQRILEKYLPGPYTFILKLKKKLPASRNKTIGIRIPKQSKIVKICKLVNVPITTTSANRSGEKNPTKLKEIDKRIIKNVDFIIDGKLKYKKPSTIVDLISNRILRLGAGKYKIN